MMMLFFLKSPISLPESLFPHLYRIFDSTVLAQHCLFQFPTIQIQGTTVIKYTLKWHLRKTYSGQNNTKQVTLASFRGTLIAGFEQYGNKPLSAAVEFGMSAFIFTFAESKHISYCLIVLTCSILILQLPILCGINTKMHPILNGSTIQTGNNNVSPILCFHIFTLYFNKNIIV